MFFGLDFEKVVLIGVIAAFLIGPERLPRVAAWLGRSAVRVRDWTSSAKVRLKEEMGDEFDDVDWRKLNPRQYDPRRIVRDALLGDDLLSPPSTSLKTPSTASAPSPVQLDALDLGAIPSSAAMVHPPVAPVSHETPSENPSPDDHTSTVPPQERAVGDSEFARTVSPDDDHESSARPAVTVTETA